MMTPELLDGQPWFCESYGSHVCHAWCTPPTHGIRILVHASTTPAAVQTALSLAGTWCVHTIRAMEVHAMDWRQIVRQVGIPYASLEVPVVWDDYRAYFVFMTPMPGTWTIEDTRATKATP